MSKTENKPKTVAVASIKSLFGIAPEFDLPVTVPRVDGTSVELKFRAKSMRKSAWAALRDEHMQDLRDNEKPIDEKEFSFAAAVGDRAADGVRLLCHGVIGWGMEEEFNAANLLALEDVLPGSVPAILSAYDRAMFHGSLGN